MDPTQTKQPLPPSPEREWQLQTPPVETPSPPPPTALEPPEEPAPEAVSSRRSWGRLILHALFILFLTLAILLLWQGVAHAS